VTGAHLGLAFVILLPLAVVLVMICWPSDDGG